MFGDRKGMGIKRKTSDFCNRSEVETVKIGLIMEGLYL